MWGRSVWRLLRSESLVGRQVSTPRGRFSPALRRGEEDPVSRGRCASQRKDVPASPGRGSGYHALLPGALLGLETLLPGLAPGGPGLRGGLPALLRASLGRPGVPPAPRRHRESPAGLLPELSLPFHCQRSRRSPPSRRSVGCPRQGVGFGRALSSRGLFTFRLLCGSWPRAQVTGRLQRLPGPLYSRRDVHSLRSSAVAVQ